MKNDSFKIAELLLGYMLLATVITGNTAANHTSDLLQEGTYHSSTVLDATHVSTTDAAHKNTDTESENRT